MCSRLYPHGIGEVHHQPQAHPERTGDINTKEAADAVLLDDLGNVDNNKTNVKYPRISNIRSNVQNPPCFPPNLKSGSQRPKCRAKQGAPLPLLEL